jgi:hypothetical protein
MALPMEVNLGLFRGIYHKFPNIIVHFLQCNYRLSEGLAILYIGVSKTTFQFFVYFFSCAIFSRYCNLHAYSQGFCLQQSQAKNKFIPCRKTPKNNM